MEFLDCVEAKEVEDVGEFEDEEVVGGVEEGFLRRWQLKTWYLSALGRVRSYLQMQRGVVGVGWQPLMRFVWIRHSVSVREREESVGRVV